MKRSSIRKTGRQASVDSLTSLFRSASSKAGSKEMERIDHLFHKYADKSSSMIGPEGIESFCSDLDMDHTDITILMLAWKMKAKNQGYFTLEEWRRGLTALHADSISKIKKVLTELEKEVTRPTSFLDFYSYAFHYSLTEDRQKTIDIESACELLDLVLCFQYRLQVNKLINYLKNQHDYNVINIDQWTSFLHFCKEINFPSLDNYHSDDAWPSILDDFVEWMRREQS